MLGTIIEWLIWRLTGFVVVSTDFGRFTIERRPGMWQLPVSIVLVAGIALLAAVQPASAPNPQVEIKPSPMPKPTFTSSPEPTQTPEPSEEPLIEPTARLTSTNTPEPTATETPAPRIPQAATLRSSNIRSGPGSDYRILRGVPENTVLEFSARTEGDRKEEVWFRLLDGEGWIWGGVLDMPPAVEITHDIPPLPLPTWTPVPATPTTTVPVTGTLTAN